MASATCSHPLPANAESSDVRSFIGRARAGAASEQRVFGAEQLIVTTNLCAELEPQTRRNTTIVRRWFRHSPSPRLEHKSDWCQDTRKGQRTAHQTGVHSSWVETEQNVGIGVPCALLQASRVIRHDYCVNMPFGAAPEGEALWRRGLFLLGNEPHLENFHHANRDTLFFNR